MTLATTTDAKAEILERVLIAGDLSKLSPADRASYYRSVCDSVGLNPLTKPFEYIVLNGKLTLYALRAAADQLRDKHGVSIDAPRIEYIDDLVIVTVTARDMTGRTDSDLGVVTLGTLKGEAKANAILKAVTKAKRRVTLSICGLGWLDETEVQSIPTAQIVEVAETGEIVNATFGQPARAKGPQGPPITAEEAQAVTLESIPGVSKGAPAPVKNATPQQIQSLQILLKACGFKDGDAGRADKLEFLAWMLELDGLASSKDLTRDQANAAIGKLGKPAPDGTLEPDSKAIADLRDEYAEWQDGQRADAEFEKLGAT